VVYCVVQVYRGVINRQKCGPIWSSPHYWKYKNLLNRGLTITSQLNGPN